MGHELTSSSEYRKTIVAMLAEALPVWSGGIRLLVADECLREEEVTPARVIWRSVECSAPRIGGLPDGRLCIAAAQDSDGGPLLVHAFFKDGHLDEVEFFKADLSEIQSLPLATRFRPYATLTTETIELLPPDAQPEP